jgi:hypothetical protein
MDLDNAGDNTPEIQVLLVPKKKPFIHVHRLSVCFEPHPKLR